MLRALPECIEDLPTSTEFGVRHFTGGAMFGFGKRKKYNGVVDIKLNNEYQIKTRNNSKFPGTLAYLEYIDMAWKAKMSEDEAALYIATLYYCGIVEHGFLDEANELYKRIKSIVKFCLSKGIVSEVRWTKFSNEIEKVNIKAGINS